MRRLASLPVILIAALALRLAFLRTYVADHPARALATIPFLFEPGNIAASLAAGHGFASPFRIETGPTAWMTPVWPLILAAIFRLFGTYTLPAFIAAAGFNVLCSTLTCIPLYLAAKRIVGPKVAAIATWLWAIFPTAILLPYESLWDASLSALLAAALLHATLVTADSERGSYWWDADWARYGLLWGLALMTNAALVSLLPFLFGWAEYRAHQRRTFSFRRPALAAAVTVLCCVPWTVRNYLVFHAFVPLRSVAALALWLGNNERGDGLTAGRLHPISNQTERDHYIEIGEIPYMREKQSQAIDYILTHPAQEVRMFSERFTAIWTGGTAHPIDGLMNAKSARFYLVVLSNLLAALGALAGIVVLWRSKSPYLIPLAAFPVVFPLVYYLALAPPRYRHPIDPVLLLLGALALVHLPNYRKSQAPALRPEAPRRHRKHAI